MRACPPRRWGAAHPAAATRSPSPEPADPARQRTPQDHARSEGRTHPETARLCRSGRLQRHRGCAFPITLGTHNDLLARVSRQPSPIASPPRTAARRAFFLTFSLTQRDAVYRRSRYRPTVHSGRRDWAGGRRRARCPPTLRAGGPAAAGWSGPELARALCGYLCADITAGITRRPLGGEPATGDNRAWRRCRLLPMRQPVTLTFSA